ncbi:MAG: SUF system NifU family Fe-S cluster assembly protein [Verrucomicrobia bacterium]|nr:SUF system NifU family Fe-S cluster assembly protein [Verrucomicrobiota bacterium]
MSSNADMDELYQEIILDHFKNPRHFSELNDDEVLVDEYNPTCGDQIRMTAVVADGVVKDIRYDGHGCAISMASASMMAEAVVGKPVDEARQIIADFVAVMRGEKDSDLAELGDMASLEGVRRYPLRIKCATMSWHAISKAIDKIAT